ncbi:unnamed protein product, partial [Cyprideis torosa]
EPCLLLVSDLALSSSEASGFFLPYLVTAALSSATPSVLSTPSPCALIQDGINRSLTKLCEMMELEKPPSKALKAKAALVLDLEQFLRTTYSKDERQVSLDLEPMGLARLAFRSGRYLLALLHLEKWCSKNEAFGQDSAVGDLLLEISSAIGDRDVFRGYIREFNKQNPLSLRQQRILLEDGLRDQKGVTSALLEAELFSAVVRNRDSEAETWAEAAWHLSQWDDPGAKFRGDGFHENVWLCLREAAAETPKTWQMEDAEKRLKTIVRGDQPSCCPEAWNTRSMAEIMGQLMVVTELSRIRDLKQGTPLSSLPAALLSPGGFSHSTINESILSFREANTALSARCIGVKAVCGPGPEYVSTVLQKASMARLSGRVDLAKHEVLALRSQQGFMQQQQLILEAARCCRSEGNYERGSRLLKVIIADEGNENVSLRNEALILFWEWTADQSADTASNIIVKCHTSLWVAPPILAPQNLQSAERSSFNTNTEKWGSARATLALVAEKNFFFLDEQIKSLESKRNVHLHTYIPKPDEEAVVNSMKREREQMITLSLQNYIAALKLSKDIFDINIFRFVYLWMKWRLDAMWMERELDGIHDIPLHKFLPVMPQLMEKMPGGDSTSKQIRRVIENVARLHPHHVVPLLLAHVNTDPQRTGSPTTAVARDILVELKKVQCLPCLPCRPLSPVPTLASLADPCLLCRPLSPVPTPVSCADPCLLCRPLSPVPTPVSCADPCLLCRPLSPVPTPVPELKTLVHQWETMVSAMINAVDPSDSPLSMDELKDLDQVVIPTLSFPPMTRVGGHGLPTVASVVREVDIVGGINQPKRIKILGSDGKIYSALLKAGDDPRPGAVMQQVFELMNQLFVNRKADLRVRTYKVLPLTGRIALIGLCEDTIPLGEYLVGSDEGTREGAHVKYGRPGDITSWKCREMMEKVASESPERKLAVYREVCSRIHPVFHHFFLEQFPDPTEWYCRRRAYVKSVATSSVVGYILGLGDRQPSNILIDKKTGEVVHINLGVAFERGNLLGDLETIPFRLTRDIVDGFGVQGVDGTFRE